MKHLFYVHSHITFLVSKQYVFDQGINPDDCLFFCVRNYALPEEYTQIFSNILSYPIDVFNNTTTKVFQGINIVQSRKNIAIVERRINDFFYGEEFYFYVPNTGLDVSSTLVTMHSCKGYFIIEEGTANYMAQCELDPVFVGIQRLFFPIAKLLFRRCFTLRKSFLNNSYKKFRAFITILPQSFNKYSGVKHIVSNPFTKEIISSQPDVVLSIDASLNIYCDKNVSQLVYKTLGRLFEDKGYHVLAYKFHPDYYKDEQLLQHYRTIIQQYFSGFTLIELPKESVIENILNNYHCDFYSDWSSVAIYSSLFNCKCYSYANLVLQLGEHPKYQIAYRRCPSINKESYICL